MNRPLLRMSLFALAGGLALLILQWHFSQSWAGYYSRFGWRGYEQAMREGRVPAFLTTSPRSFLLGSSALFALPLLTLWFGGWRPLRSSLALWAGVVVSLVGVWVATPQLRQNANLWPIDMILLFFGIGLPMMAGVLTVLAIEKVNGRLKRAA